MVTCFVEGTTRTRIIDCVRTWSEKNLESSSEPSRSTVNAPVGCGEGLGVGVKRRVGEADGEATLTVWPVTSQAVAAAGRKYANAPADADRTTANPARAAERERLRRRREARARRPG